MEQFKQLNWSWNQNYMEEDNKFSRKFEFNTINQNDILSRTLNEVHKAVLPVDNEYKLFKPSRFDVPDDIEVGGMQTLKDPRRNFIKSMNSTEDMIKSFEHSSTLTRIEQMNFLDSVMKQQKSVEHNPKILIEKRSKRATKLKLLQYLIDKRKTEIEKFNKSAEISYYQEMNNFSKLINESQRKFLCDLWNANRSDANYSVITMILRDQNYSTEVDVKIEQIDDGVCGPSLTKSFPLINKLTNEDLKNFPTMNRWDNVDSLMMNISADSSVLMTMTTLTKLFIDSDEFQVKFCNYIKGDNDDNDVKHKITKFDETFPMNPVKVSESLSTLAHLSLRTSCEIENFKSFMENMSSSDQQSSDYKLEKISDFFKKFYEKFRNSSSSVEGRSSHRVVLRCGNQEINLIVMNDGFYHVENLDQPAQISIKLEYQTHFGAATMTRDELLREWCLLKFFPNSQLVRFRIDAVSLTILSKELVKLEDIENRLEFNSLMMNFFHIISSMNRLPESRYLIQARHENYCKKLFIYKEGDGKPLLQDPWSISSNFDRKFTPLDENFVTFLHLNQEIPPCCFAVPFVIPAKTKAAKVQSPPKKPYKFRKIKKRKAKVNKK